MAPIGVTKKPLEFKVTRGTTEVITPARPTPNEFKELSDIDDQFGLRMLVPLIMCYRKQQQGKGMLSDNDPAKVVKEAVSKALVPYYPLAGRLRQKQGMETKLVVECNGEGIIFTEANADVTLEEFGEPLHPPFPCLDQLLFDVPGCDSVLDSPLIVMQVTKLKCSGFIIVTQINHTMADGQGIFQFLNAMTELANGASSPSIQPVWARHLLRARNPPQVTCQHHEYKEIVEMKGNYDATFSLDDDMVLRSFYFGTNEINALKNLIPSHVRCSTFEIIATCLWRCHTISLRLDPEEMASMMITVNARSVCNPPLAKGYYGNAFTSPLVICSVKNLCHGSITYALELLKKVKADVTQEYMKSLADLVVLKDKPMYSLDHRTFLLSDITPFQNLDFDCGWGQPTFVGTAETGFGALTGGFYMKCKNAKGENKIVISISLPTKPMEIFVQELNKLLANPPKHSPTSGPSNIISSSL